MKQSCADFEEKQGPMATMRFLLQAPWISLRFIRNASDADFAAIRKVGIKVRFAIEA